MKSIWRLPRQPRMSPKQDLQITKCQSLSLQLSVHLQLCLKLIFITDTTETRLNVSYFRPLPSTLGPSPHLLNINRTLAEPPNSMFSSEPHRSWRNRRFLFVFSSLACWSNHPPSQWTGNRKHNGVIVLVLLSFFQGPKVQTNSSCDWLHKQSGCRRMSPTHTDSWRAFRLVSEG